jgi:hypothetical protein
MENALKVTLKHLNGPWDQGWVLAVGMFWLSMICLIVVRRWTQPVLSCVNIKK